MTRNEFKNAISKMSRSDLIGLLCDIYYANAQDGNACNCECECGSEAMETPTKAKRSVKRSKGSKVSKVAKKRATHGKDFRS